MTQIFPFFFFVFVVVDVVVVVFNFIYFAICLSRDKMTRYLKMKEQKKRNENTKNDLRKQGICRRTAIEIAADMTYATM